MNIRFSDLTKNDILNKLDIDFRLIKSFKKVMQKIDKYFDEHSYYEDIEFNHLITEYLKNIYTLKIQVTDGLVEGIYNSYYNTISLNKDLLASSDLEHILCHEFIHFLTSHNYPPLEQVDDVISNCLTEVLTEMLATDIIEEKLEYKCYYDYCILMNYLNEIAGITDYKAFLQRKLDSKYLVWQEYGVFNEMDKALDKTKYLDSYGYLDKDTYISLVYSILSPITEINFNDIDSLTSVLTKVYLAPVDREVLEKIGNIIEGLVNIFLINNNINEEVTKNKIMKLIKNKNIEENIELRRGVGK